MKIVFICPYFGKLPEYFQLWLNSCKYNKDIDWLVITDDKTDYKYPKNVKPLYWTFDQTKNYIQNRFDFRISLKTPYKLCDFKPAYGYIFEELISEYDLWGHCDIDCIFGDIKYFINNDIIEKYDKILDLGHMTIYKNKYDVNRRFMLDTGKELNYRVVYSNEESFCFDEWNNRGSINDIYENNKFKFYSENIYADINCLYYKFKLTSFQKNSKSYKTEDKNQILLWDKGKLYSVFIEDNKILKNEYAYVHFQKRKVKVEINDVENLNKMILIPNKFVECTDEIDREYILKNSKSKIFYNMYFKQRYKNLKIKTIKILNNTFLKEV